MVVDASGRLVLSPLSPGLGGAGAGSGEANTASNIGIGTGSVFAQKVGVDLRFRRLLAGSGVNIATSGNSIRIDAQSQGDAQLRIDFTNSSGIFQAGTDTANQVRTDFDNSSGLFVKTTPNQNVLYVGKHGNDSNDGTTIENALLTFSSGIVVANSQSPGLTNRFTLQCFDAGIYAENIVLPAFVGVEAPDATISGVGGSYTVELEENTTVTINEVIGGAFSAVGKTSPGISHVEANKIKAITAGTSCLENASGILTARVNQLICDGPSTVGITESSLSGINISIKEILINTDSSTGILATNGKVLGNVDRITKNSDGLTGTTALQLTGLAEINLNNSDIIADTVYNVASGSSLSLSTRRITGTRTTADGSIVYEFSEDKVISNQLEVFNEFILPTTDGLTGQVMRTDGSGIVSWDNGLTQLEENFANSSGVFVKDGDNVGAGIGVFKQKTANQILQFKSLIAGSGLNITGGVNDITISRTDVTIGSGSTIADHASLHQVGSHDISITANQYSAVSGFTIVDDLQNFRMSASGELEFIGQGPAECFVSAFISTRTSTPNELTSWRFATNGVTLPNSQIDRFVATTGDTGALAIGEIVPFNAGDRLQVFVTSNSNTTVTTEKFSLEVFAIVGGQNNINSNVGLGTGEIFAQKIGATMELRRLLAGSGMQIATSGNTVRIDSTLEDDVQNNLANITSLQTDFNNSSGIFQAGKDTADGVRTDFDNSSGVFQAGVNTANSVRTDFDNSSGIFQAGVDTADQVRIDFDNSSGVFRSDIDTNSTNISGLQTDFDNSSGVFVKDGENLGGAEEIFIQKNANQNLEFRTLLGGSGIQVAASGNIIRVDGRTFPQENIIYVGKHGISGINDGKTIENAVPTFEDAITLATAESPSATNRMAIVCLDAGKYTSVTSALDIPEHVDLYAPNATLAKTGTFGSNFITVRDDSNVCVDTIDVFSTISVTCFLMSAQGPNFAKCSLKANNIILDTLNEVGIDNSASSGRLDIDIGNLTGDNASFTGIICRRTGIPGSGNLINGSVKSIRAPNTAEAIAVGPSCRINLDVDEIEFTNPTDTIGIHTFTLGPLPATANINVKRLVAVTGVEAEADTIVNLHAGIRDTTTDSIDAAADLYEFSPNQVISDQLEVKDEYVLPLTDGAVSGQVITTDGAGTTNFQSIGSLLTSQENIIYVGKHGNDSNNGKTLNDAVLTFSQAVTLATAESPSATNRVAIVCVDAGIYSQTDSLDIPQHVDLYAPNATLERTGTTGNDFITVENNSNVTVHEINVNTPTKAVGAFDMTINGPNFSKCSLKANKITMDAINEHPINNTSASGTLFVDVGDITTQNVFITGVRCTTTGISGCIINGSIKTLKGLDRGTAIALNAGSQMNLDVGEIEILNSTQTIGIHALAGSPSAPTIANININRLNVVTGVNAEANTIVNTHIGQNLSTTNSINASATLYEFSPNRVISDRLQVEGEYTLPTFDGNVGDVLTQTGAGITSFQPPDIGANLTPHQQILYVGKHGDDGNDGLTLETAVLSFNQALTLASEIGGTGIPSSGVSEGNRVTITCFDAGRYEEGFTCLDWVDIYAPNAWIERPDATQNATIGMAENSKVTFKEIKNRFGFWAVEKMSPGRSELHAERVIASGTGGIGLLVANGTLDAHVGQLLLKTGNSDAVFVSSGILNLYTNEIRDTAKAGGSKTSSALFSAGGTTGRGTINAHINQIISKITDLLMRLLV
jgi:hypothetical protein